jgi:hypothetical protein
MTVIKKGSLVGAALFSIFTGLISGGFAGGHEIYQLATEGTHHSHLLAIVYFGVVQLLSFIAFAFRTPVEQRFHKSSIFVLVSIFVGAAFFFLILWRYSFLKG